MKNNLKLIVCKLPGVKGIYNKLNRLEKKINELECENNILSNQNIDLRLKLKKISNEKINVVFVCHRPAVWESLHSVYDAIKNDDAFCATIVAIPNKKELKDLGLNHEQYESEGAEDFWKEYGGINGYDYKTGEWFDLRTLKPDYVFFQQPYNITRPSQYKSHSVSKYAKICYVAYAYDFIGGGVLEECSPQDYIKDVSFYFTQNIVDDELVKKVLKEYGNDFTRTYISGFPRYDYLNEYMCCESDAWRFSGDNKRYRVMWTPRWCTNEGNCSFFDYKDKIVEYMRNNNNYEFIFRPHPQAFMNWNRTGKLTEEDAEIYMNTYKNSNNMSIDQKKFYLDTICSSDCLISDTSSFIADYFMTGKPIIYCHKVNTFNEVAAKMSEGFYWIQNWKELKYTLENLRQGIDPLMEKRMEILYELGICGGKFHAGESIKEYIKKDALK